MTTTITGFGIDPVIPSAALSPPLAGVLYNEGVCRAWVSFQDASVIDDSFNVSAVTDNGTGLTTVTWDTDFADALYALTFGCDQNAGGGRVLGTDGSRLVGSVALRARNASTAATADGFFPGNVMAFGAQ